MKIDENLEQQYDEVIKYINAYRAYVRRLRARLLYLPITDPRKYLRLLKEAPSGWRQVDLLSGKNTQFDQLALTATVMDEEKQSEYYAILATDYSLHRLSISLDTNFPDVDFEKLKDLHELKTSRVSPIRIKQMVGIVLAGATLLLKSIPQSVVSRIMDYKQFELAIFLIASLAILYLLLILLPVWLKSIQASNTHAYAKEVLEYTCIRK